MRRPPLSTVVISVLTISAAVALIVALAGPSKAAAMSKGKPTTRTYSVSTETTLAPFNTKRRADLWVTHQLDDCRIARDGAGMPVEVTLTLERRVKHRFRRDTWDQVGNPRFNVGCGGQVVWPDVVKGRYRETVTREDAEGGAIDGTDKFWHSGGRP